MKNSDKIRHMTDEELAEYVFCYKICPPGKDYFDCRKIGITCKQCRLQWLQQDAEN